MTTKYTPATPLPWKQIAEFLEKFADAGIRPDEWLLREWAKSLRDSQKGSDNIMDQQVTETMTKIEVALRKCGYERFNHIIHAVNNFPRVLSTLKEAESVLLELTQYLGSEHQEMADEMANSIYRLRRELGEAE